MDATVETPRKDTPQRWARAAARAAAEGIEIRQCAGSGLWIATSDSRTAYELGICGSVAFACSCLAGMNDDPVCKHRAAYYLMVGALAINPEPPTPAAPAMPVVCPACRGDGRVWTSTWAWSRGTADGWWSGCHACDGAGESHALSAA